MKRIAFGEFALLDHSSKLLVANIVENLRKALGCALYYILNSNFSTGFSINQVLLGPQKNNWSTY